MKIYTKYFINNVWQKDFHGYELGYDDIETASVWLCEKEDGTKWIVIVDLDTHEIIEEVPDSIEVTVLLK